MYNRLLIITIFSMFIACNLNKNNFKEGAFNLYINDTPATVIERYDDYQFERSLKKDKNRFSKIEWSGDTLYFLESIVKKDSLDYKNLYVKIDSINADTSYFTSYVKGIDFEFSSKIVKIGNEISQEFKDLMKKETAQ